MLDRMAVGDLPRKHHLQLGRHGAKAPRQSLVFRVVQGENTREDLL